MSAAPPHRIAQVHHWFFAVLNETCKRHTHTHTHTHAHRRAKERRRRNQYHRQVIEWTDEEYQERNFPQTVLSCKLNIWQRKDSSCQANTGKELSPKPKKLSCKENKSPYPFMKSLTTSTTENQELVANCIRLFWLTRTKLRARLGMP